MKYILILLASVLIAGCSQFTMIMPDGTKITHTRFFDDQQLADVHLSKTDGFEGSIGKLDNTGKIDAAQLLEFIKTLGVMK